VTGYASTDGTTWTTVGAIDLTSLPTTAQAGPFVASPDTRTSTQQLGGGSSTGQPVVAPATFGALDLQGQQPTSTWTGTAVGASPQGAGGLPAADAGGFHTAGGAYTVSGSGDIAPDAGQSGSAIGQILVGGFGALIVMIVLGVLFITTEYRRGLIRTSLTVSPRRGRVLLAKATVIGAVTFVTAL